MPDGENIGDNSGATALDLDSSEILKLTTVLERQEKEIEAKQAEKAKTRSAIKALGVPLGEFDEARKLMKQPRSKREKSFGTLRKLMEILGDPLSSQISFEFEKPKKPTKATEEKHANEEAFMQGLVAGRRDEPADPPYDATSPAGQEWLKGHAQGASEFDADLAAQLLKDESVDIDDDDGGSEGDVDDDGNPIETSE